MAFCPNCGASVEGNFCGKCGKAVNPAAAPAPPSAAGMPESTAAALCYVLGLITGIIFLVLEPYNKSKLVRFHAFQSIFLNVVVVIILFVLEEIMPWSLWRVMRLVNIACYGLFLYMLLQTYQGKKISLPVIGDLAEKQA